MLAQAREGHLLSDDHFTVDGTLIEAWASHKSCKRKDEPPAPPAGGTRNATVDFKKEQRRNETHQSTTDPDCRLFKKSAGAAAQL